MGKQYVSMGFGGILIYFHANGSTTIPPDIKINVVNLRIDHQFTNRGVPISAVVYNIYLINMILYNHQQWDKLIESMKFHRQMHDRCILSLTGLGYGKAQLLSRLRVLISSPRIQRLLKTPLSLQSLPLVVGIISYNGYYIPYTHIYIYNWLVVSTL